jgi:hypothetical protein
MTRGTRPPRASPSDMGTPTRVLVADLVNGRSRSAVAAVRALAAGGFRPVVAVSAPRSTAAASRACKEVIYVPGPGRRGFAEAVRRELASARYVGVLAASDAVLLELDLPGASLINKAALPGRAAAAGLAVPPTAVFPDRSALLAAAPDLDYPLVIKPVFKSSPASVARMVVSSHDLVRLDDVGACIVQPYKNSGLRAVSGVVYRGSLIASVHQRYLRTWPQDCGVASAAVTIAPDLELERRLPRLLNGHDGIFQIQLVGELVIDVNPRVYGSLPLAVAAGANLPAIACAAMQGRVGELIRGRPGVHYRWLEGDLRHVAQAVRRGSMTPLDAARAILPRPGTAHSVESLADPGPILARLADVAGRWWRR